MWCANCKADVAAQVAPDSGLVACAACGAELAQANAIRERTRDARAILEKWSTQNLRDPFGPLPGRKTETKAEPTVESASQAVESASQTVAATAAKPVPAETPEPPASESQPPVEATEPSAEPAVPQVAEREQPDTDEQAGESVPAQPTEAAARPASPSRKYRIDAAETREQTTQTGSHRSRTRREQSVVRTVHGSHGKTLPGPHFEMAPAPRANWMASTGQWLAYIGVLGLTVGTAIVVYGHFGGQASYTPTGWLVTTVGQMLLFLGVINLVSGGMEKSNDEVSQRIAILGEHILRIEEAAGALRPDLTANEDESIQQAG